MESRLIKFTSFNVIFRALHTHKSKSNNSDKMPLTAFHVFLL